MGSMNSDCWYMYTMKDWSMRPITSEPGKYCPLIGQLILILSSDWPDQTIEILMSELDQDIMNIFHQHSSQSAREAREKSGIDRLVPNMKIDDYLFEPCGYSMNGVLENVSNQTKHFNKTWLH